MRTLTLSELNYTNGGIALDRTFFKENILKAGTSGAAAGVALGFVLGQSNLGRYAMAYSAAAVAYKLTTSLLSEVI